MKMPEEIATAKIANKDIPYLESSNQSSLPNDIKRDVKELHTKEDILSSAKSVQVWNELNEDYLAANPYVASLMSFAELATPQDVIAKYRKAASTSHSSKSSSASIELVFVGAKAATINAEQNDWYSTIDSF